MTTTDEALLWAREQVAVRMEQHPWWKQNASAVREGESPPGPYKYWDLLLAKGYRAGQQSAEARVKVLEGEVARLREALSAIADGTSYHAETASGDWVEAIKRARAALGDA